MFFKKLIRLVFLVITGSVLNFTGYAQSGSAGYIPKLIPPSPNAATIAKYSDVPVSTYNGTSDISIPISNVQARGLSIPVSLGYHTGGIRLKEEAGWVGLGWALNAGGSISRTIMDKDDFGGHYFNMPIPEVSTNVQTQTSFTARPFMGTYGYDFYCNYLVNTDAGIIDFSQAFASGGGLYDVEPDIFNYSFPGHSGKFMITRTGKVLIQKQENIKIQFETNGNSFTITDESGNKYFFLDKEYTKGQQPDWKISSWMLSKIITQLGDTVTFSYVQDNTWTSVRADIFETSRTGCPSHQGLTGVESSANEYLNVTLQKIDYSGGQIQFVFDGNRTDLQNGKKLNNVKVYAKDPKSNTLSYIKEHDFYYSYFNPTQTPAVEFTRLRLDSVKEISSTLAIPAYSFSYVDPNNNSLSGKHSFSVDDWGFFNGKNNTTFIPPFQGVYENVVLQPTYVDLPGADKTPDSVFMQYFSLQKVIYPTGGSTVLEYQANDYDKTKSQKGGLDFPQQQLVDTTWRLNVSSAGTITGNIDFSHIFQTIPSINLGSNATLTVAFLGRNNNDAVDLHNGQFNQVYFTFLGATYDIASNALGISCPFGALCTTPTIQLAINNNISFPFTAFVSSSATTKLSNMSITITWKELRDVHYQNSNVSLLAGGLRVKTITDYNTDNTIAKKRRYEYNITRVDSATGTPTKYSLGRLMSFPSYARLEPFAGGGSTASCESLTLTGSSNSSITSVVNGNIVAYDSVSEYIIDPSTGVDIGKTVYSYYNSPDLSQTFGGFRLPGVPNEGDNLDGSLLSKVVYSQSAGIYKPISRTDNFFHVTNKSLYYSLKSSLEGSTSGSAVTGCPNGACVPQEYLGNFYPSLKSERVLLDSSLTTTYDQFDNSKTIFSMSRNYYDNTLHYQMTRTTQQDSKGNTHVSVMKYPQDYIPSGQTVTNNTILDSMIIRNMVSEVIEKRDSILYGGSSSGAKINGAQLSKYKIITGNSLAMDKQYKFDQVGPVGDFQPFAISGNTTSMDNRYRQLISLDNYDNTNNIGQYTSVDQTPVSVLWDYKNIYPVAQVKNAALADIAFTSFEADGSGSWTIASPIRDTAAITGNQCYNLSSGNISKSGLTNGKVYLLTYWSQNGTYSLSGGTVTSKTGRAVNGWTYYEQTLTTSSTTITLSGTGKIDELRLYPKGALMTSYTYSPLVGQSASDDPAGEITYYDYDALTRLKNIRDYQSNIVKNFQYNYGNGCADCYLPMQTFAGTGTLSYPVGVFNVNRKLLGNATSQSQYVSLWNGDSLNHLIGTLSAGADSLHFKIAVNASKTTPSSVFGCRYYQFDLSYNVFDGIRNGNATYVDFGDGTGVKLNDTRNEADSSNIILPPNSTLNFFSGGTSFRIIHTYPDTTLKTITFYHNDANEYATLDNFNSPATSLSKLKNFRGNLSQANGALTSTSFQNSSANSIANISNWNQINTDTVFSTRSGDGNTTLVENISFVQDFMKNNLGLKRVSIVSTTDTSFKISRLKSDWNSYFIQLQNLVVGDDNWNRENLSNLKALNFVSILKPSQSSTPTHLIDSVINQLARGAGQTVNDGTIDFNVTGGTTRTSASDSAFYFLLSRGWQILLNATQSQGLTMQTFAGTNTLSYPVGVFNVNGKLLGNVSNQSQYVTTWNSDTADQHRGVLAAGTDSMHFALALASGVTAPASVTGCRYYQYDLSYTIIDAVRNRNAAYIDFGDSTGMRMGSSYTDIPATLAPNTTYQTINGGDINSMETYFKHTYPNSNSKTITFYHNDSSELPGFDNLSNPATSLTLIRNLRGILPQHMSNWSASSFQQSSALTFDSITNWNTISSVAIFHSNIGDGATGHPWINVSFSQDFMQNNQLLTDITIGGGSYYSQSIRDSTFKISRLKSDWNTYFLNLQSLHFNDGQWNREDLTALHYLKSVVVTADTQKHSNDQTSNPIVSMPSSLVDSIIVQIANGAGQFVTNGAISIRNNGVGRTSASNTAYSFLLSKGWTITLL